jgi:hypothetical protein
VKIIFRIVSRVFSLDIFADNTRRRVRSFAAVLAALCAITAPVAQAFTITFEDLAVGAVLSNQYAATLGVTFTPNTFTGPGSSSSGKPWATNTNLTVVSSAGADIGGLGTPILASGNIVRSFNAWLNEDGDASVRVSFAYPVQDCAVTFAGINNTPADTRMVIYNGAVVIGTSVATATAVTTSQQTLSFAAASITSIVLTPGSFDDWVGFDNLTCTPAAGPSKLVITAQPNPSVVALAPFNVTVQSQTAAGTPISVAASTLVTLAIQTGSGALSGTPTCTIAALSNSCTVTGIASNTAQTGLLLRATSNPALTSADTVAFDVIAKSQTITFPPITAFSWYQASATLAATATSMLPVSYSVLSGACSVAGNVLSATYPGTCTVAANQPGNASFAAAAQQTQTVTVNVGPALLDIDASSGVNRYDAATDGMMVLRYLLGYRGAAISAGVIGAGATRTPAQIEAHMADLLPLLDVDGDGVAHATTDGVLIVRYLFGLRLGPLLQGVAPGPNAAAQVEAAIGRLKP